METLLTDPTGGDAAKGKKLADKYCMTCHLDGRVGPVWAPGLYEPDWVVRRVRRLEGHANQQMPAFTHGAAARRDLRDIVTYLTSPQSAPPMFNRKHSARPRPQRPAGSGRKKGDRLFLAAWPKKQPVPISCRNRPVLLRATSVSHTAIN